MTAQPTSSGRRPSRLSLGIVARAASVVVLGIGVAAIAGPGRGEPIPAATAGPSLAASTAPSGRPSPTVAAAPGYAPMTTARVTQGFRLGGQLFAGSGQSILVIGPDPDAGPAEPAYLVQHWGDLVAGIRPDTTIASVPVATVNAQTTPYEPVCPAGTTDVAAIGALQPFERLACYGSRDVTLDPVRVESYVVMDGNPPWLAGPAGVDFLIAIPFDPEASIAVPGEGWLRVVGHFDDPACDAADVRCRERFVVTEALATGPPPSEFQGTWTQMADAPIEGRMEYVALDIGDRLFVWGGTGPVGAPTGAIYEPATDRWTAVAEAPGPGRFASAAVWTGRRVLVWGGLTFGAGGDLQDVPGGLAYDPAADAWTVLPDAPLPAGAADGVWTGTEFLVMSTSGASAAYDPEARRWRALPDAALPSGRMLSSWTGDRWLVLAFADGAQETLPGAAYEPAADAWTPIALPPYGGEIDGIEPVWTGTTWVLSGHGYDPTADAWRELVLEDCRYHGGIGGVWTGTVIISQDEAYDPVEGRCSRLPYAPRRPTVEPGPGLPDGIRTHEFATLAWVDGRLIVWSGGTGLDGPGAPPDGAVFTPATGAAGG